LAVAASEVRTIRRLARTWMFVVLGTAAMGTAFGFFSNLHASMSFGSLSIANTLPRFSTGYFNSYVLWFFMAAVVFLAFDLLSRDARERMREVLESRPVSNLAVLGGRLVAVMLAVAIPLLGALLLIQAAAVIGQAFGLPIHPIEPVATFTFFFLDSIPALTLWCAIVGFLAVGLGNRLATAIAALALLGAHMWSFAITPVYLLPAVSLLHIHDNLASDLAPRFADAEIILQRASTVFLAAAFAVWAAALYKRPDGSSRRRRVVLGSVLATLGVAGIGTVVLRCIDGVHERDSWLTAHESVVDLPTPTAVHLGGNVRIDPGRNLGLDIEMELAGNDLGTLVFSFNPGLEIADLRMDGVEVPYRHQDGLLIVEPPSRLAPGSNARLALRASGVPDPDFAYLDSAVDWRRVSGRNYILWRGTAGGIFEKSYAALTPALRWLPVPGPNLDRVPSAYFPTLDLTVEVPSGWLVAGPGRRSSISDGRYRFQPQEPVRAVGLFAARFERRAMEVAGVELELLLHPDHLQALPAFANGRELLESRLGEILDRAAELGIPYPYRGFSVVEVPTFLRTYGGGPWLDTATALPGILLLREHGFPFAHVRRFDDANQFASLPGGLDAWKIRYLEQNFSSPLDGESAMQALSRNLVTFQSVAHGPGAVALDHIGEELAAELLAGPITRPRWSGWSFLYTAHQSNVDANFGSTIMQVAGGIASRVRASGPGAFGSFLAPQSATWERALEASLVDLDLARDPGRAVAAYGLRARAVVLAILDGAGSDGTASFLAELRQRHSGGTYDAHDFAAAANAAGIDLDGLIGDWMNEAALPGFVTSNATVVRVADDDQGRPRYETRVHVRNAEPVAGLVRLSQGVFPRSPRGEPFRVPGNTTVDVGMVGAAPPPQLWLEPYLALNRQSVRIELVELDTQTGRQPSVGVGSSTWMPPPPVGIVIDDLDPGFSVEDRDRRTRIGAGSATRIGGWQREFDRGLPTNSRRPGEWVRATIPFGWGRYRHTIVGAIAGDGPAVAVFAANLTRPGRWRLDYFVPDPGTALNFGLPMYRALGAVEMKLLVDGRETAIVFDGAAAETGWNTIDEFDFTSTDVRLEISSRTDGQMVIADAIRWLPLD